MSVDGGVGHTPLGRKLAVHFLYRRLYFVGQTAPLIWQLVCGARECVDGTLFFVPHFPPIFPARYVPFVKPMLTLKRRDAGVI